MWRPERNGSKVCISTINMPNAEITYATRNKYLTEHMFDDSISSRRKGCGAGSREERGRSLERPTGVLRDLEEIEEGHMIEQSVGIRLTGLTDR